MKYLFYKGDEKDLLNKGFKYNGYAYELESLGEYATPRLTIHFENQKGIILFNYCSPYDVIPSDILNFLKKTENKPNDFFYRETKYGTIPNFRWHHKFGVISDEDWTNELKKFSLEDWFLHIEGLDGFKLNKEVYQLREILNFLEIRNIGEE